MPRSTRSHVEADRPLARQIGTRLRLARHQARLTQAALAEGRYTKAYVSALENGLVKPSLAALNFFAGRLGIPVTRLLSDPAEGWNRLEADVRLAAGEWQAAADGYEALLGTASARERPELLRGLAEAYCRMDRGAEGVRAAAEAAAAFGAAGRELDAAWSSYWEAFGLYQLEQSDQARRLLASIEDRLAAGVLRDADLTVRTAIAAAMVESRDDRPEQALALLERARAASGELDGRRRATFLFSLALTYREMGDLEGAMVTAQQSLSHFRAASADLEVASIENELALVHLARGRLDAARTHAATARALFNQLGNDRWLAHVADTEAQIALAAGDVGQAVSLATAAVETARQAENWKAAVSAFLTLGRAHRATGGLASAREALDQAATIARDHARRGQLQAVLGELAQIVAEQGDLQLAFKLSQEALAFNRLAAPPAANRAPSRAGSSRSS